MNQQLKPEIIRMLASLYFSSAAATTALQMVGFPQQDIPEFKNATSFWSDVVSMLDLGFAMEDGVERLLENAVATYIGNKELRALIDKLRGGQQPVTVTPGPQAEPPDRPTPTLTLVGLDMPTEFLEAVRRQLGSDAAELLYVSNNQCAVAIPDPGDQAVRFRQEIQALMQTYAGDAPLQVTYEKYSFRPYLYTSLIVHGPDTTPYELQSVPATLRPGDIAAALIAETRGAMTNAKGDTVSTVIDLESENGRERLDPDKTLHENKVRDKSKMRLGAKVVAGSISPELRMEAQLRMRAQLRRFAFAHPDFEIVDYDNEDLPNRIVFELEGPGLAPPENLREFLAGTENLNNTDFQALPWEQLTPVEIGFHRFTMHLTAMFPVVAPFVVWNTPVFHPNIWREPVPGARPGMVCLGPLMDGYRPDLDFGYLAQLLIDIATYRNYDVVEDSTYPDPAAALWARTERGQRQIQAIGGPPMRLTTLKREDTPLPKQIWLTRLGDEPTAGA